VSRIAYILCVICIIIAGVYFVLPGGSLPTFFPGYALDATRVHKLHAFAAVTIAIVFLLIGLSTQRR
jgi:hypothetical protein